MDANVHLFLGQTDDPDEKDAKMQEIVRKMLHSSHYSREACTYAGFPVHPLDMFKKTALTHLFRVTAAFSMPLLKVPDVLNRQKHPLSSMH